MSCHHNATFLFIQTIKQTTIGDLPVVSYLSLVVNNHYSVGRLRHRDTDTFALSQRHPRVLVGPKCFCGALLYIYNCWSSIAPHSIWATCVKILYSHSRGTNRDTHTPVCTIRDFSPRLKGIPVLRKLAFIYRLRYM